MTRQRGFSLVELMVVVTLIGVISSLAVISWRRSRSIDDADAWANTIRNVVNQARRRAVATNSTYMIDLRATSIQWCQVSDTAGCTALTANPTCPNAATGMENGVAMYAGSDAVTYGYIHGPDAALPSVTYAGATPTVLPAAGIAIYFGANGTVDGGQSTLTDSYTSVRCLKPGPPTGFTAYVKASNSGGTTSQTQKRRRVIVYGASGRPRIIDNW